MEILITFFGWAIFALLITSMTKPIEDFKKKIGIHHTDEPKRYVGKFFRDLFNCEYCFAFWSGMIVFLPDAFTIGALVSYTVPMAALLSMTAHLLYFSYQKFIVG